MPSVYRRKNKDGKTTSWKAVVRIKGYPSVCKSFERQKEADDWANTIERQIKRGMFKFDQHNKLYTLEELIERFINDVKLEHHKSSKDTLRHLNYWKEKFGNFALVHITSNLIGKERKLLINTQINKNSKTLKRSPATINRYMSSLSSILTYAKKLNWIDENPCFALSKLKEADGRDKVLSVDELQNLLLACKNSTNKYLYCIVLIAITTGARKSEILSLKWSDIDLDNQIAYLRKTKNNRPRTIPLIDEIIEEIKNIQKHKQPNKELIFASKTVFGMLDIKKPWQIALKEANIKGFVFHSLRHQFATMAAKQGASTLELQTATGHLTLSQLVRYSHLESNITRKFSKNIFEKISGEKS